MTAGSPGCRATGGWTYNLEIHPAINPGVDDKTVAAADTEGYVLALYCS
jgi:hypothetical protein